MSAATFNLMALGVPVLLGGVLIEAYIARKRKREVYHLGAAVSDLSCGITFQALEVFFNLFALGVYAWIFHNARLIDFAPGSPWPWIIGMVGVDLLFYWWHRCSHVINVLWAVHGVHHQSEEYNLAVALRQPAFEPLTWFLFYVPLAFIGVAPEIYLGCYAINRLYQFWIHTELVDRMHPWAEWILNTPSHHRVHHGVNEQYLDKNYGAILIIWDRLFQTFEPETERPQYGTTIPIRSYAPLWGNFEYFTHIASLARRAQTVHDKLWAWVAHPAWLPAGVPAPVKPDRSTYQKYRPEVPTLTQLYAVVQLGLLLVPMFLFFLYEPQFSMSELLLGSAAVIWAVATIAALLEGRQWPRTSEPFRLAVSLLAVFVLGRHIAPPRMLLLLAGCWALLHGLSWGLWSRPDSASRDAAPPPAPPPTD